MILEALQADQIKPNQALDHQFVQSVITLPSQDTAIQAWSKKLGINMLLMKDGSQMTLRDFYRQLPRDKVNATATCSSTVLTKSPIISMLKTASEELQPKPIIATPQEIDQDLLQASKDGDIAIVTYLLKKGANINFQDEEGLTPLAHAKINQHAGVIELLKSVQSSSTVNKLPNSPLSSAYQRHGLLTVQKRSETPTQTAISSFSLLSSDDRPEDSNQDTKQKRL